MLEKAIEIAVGAHMGQIDKAGEPYILHPIRVMLLGKDKDQQIVGILHDVIEDTPISLEMLKREGFSDEIVKALDFMTHKNEDSYDAYIDKIATNDLAISVKLHDLTDNMNRSRIVSYKEADERRHQKYEKAYKKLSEIAKEKDILF